MKKHMKIGAATCTDMINAFNDKISELDPGYIESAESIEAGEVCPECGELVENCMCGSCCDDDKSTVEGSDEPIIDDDQEYIQGEGSRIVDEEYVDEMMSYVADEMTDPEFDATCSWRVEDDNLIFVLAGLSEDTLEEYTCPLADLTGDIDADIDYILESVRG